MSVANEMREIAEGARSRRPAEAKRWFDTSTVGQQIRDVAKLGNDRVTFDPALSADDCEKLRFLGFDVTIDGDQRERRSWTVVRWSG